METRSWNQTTDVPDAELKKFFITPTLQVDPEDETKQQVQNNVQISLRWGGVTESTMLWHAMMYRGEKLAIATAADVGISLLTQIAPVEDDTFIIVDNFAALGAEMPANMRFMVWPSHTIYTLTADATSITDYAAAVAGSGVFNTGIALDLENDKIYWLENYDTIRSANIDGTNITTDIITGLTLAFSIKLKPSANKMYFSDSTTKKISYADLDGSNSGDLITGASTVYAIALDENYMYWGESSGKLLRCDLATGSNLTEIITGQGAGQCKGIEIDTTNSLIYWTNSTDGKI